MISKNVSSFISASVSMKVACLPSWPHFLYRTLELVRSFNKVGGGEISLGSCAPCWPQLFQTTSKTVAVDGKVEHGKIRAVVFLVCSVYPVDRA